METHIDAHFDEAGLIDLPINYDLTYHLPKKELQVCVPRKLSSQASEPWTVRRPPGIRSAQKTHAGRHRSARKDPLSARQPHRGSEKRITTHAEVDQARACTFARAHT